MKWILGLLIAMAVTAFPYKSFAAKSRVKKTIHETYSATEEETDAVTFRSDKPKPLPKFDPVPTAQVAPIASRLKIVDAILRKYGRAYDYRTHTFRELQEILEHLDMAAAAPPTPPAVPEDQSAP
ncbi:MAG: hypothetical protein ACXWP5_02850 [Bdellovibrionota bacterium]